MAPLKIPPMTLIYHPHSPFSRQVYITALELGIASSITLQKVVVAPVLYPGWSDDNNAVAAFNPLAKIPTLVLKSNDEEIVIFDSKNICEYLNEGLGDRKLSWTKGESCDGVDIEAWKLKTLHALANGICDAEVLVVYEQRIREERGLKFQSWIEGQREKIGRGLDRLNMEVGEGVLLGDPGRKEVNVAEIAVACAVSFLDTRGLEWRVGRGSLEEWFVKWEGRKTFLSTSADVDWRSFDSK